MYIEYHIYYTKYSIYDILYDINFLYKRKLTKKVWRTREKNMLWKVFLFFIFGAFRKSLFLSCAHSRQTCGRRPDVQS